MGKDFDFIGESSDRLFTKFFKLHFNHDFQSGKSRSHASSNQGYAEYCSKGIISEETQAKIKNSGNMKIYQEILSSNNAQIG